MSPPHARAVTSPTIHGAAIEIQAPFERLRAATAEHDQLLQRIARRRQVLTQLEHDLRDSAARMASRIGPLVDEAADLDRAIHAMFQELLADRARSRAQRTQIGRLYRDLQGDIISVAAPPEPNEAGIPGAPLFDDLSADAPEAPSATRPGDRSVLRGLFRRLAEALHPDKVQDADDKARRTEVMKQITVAYQRGDLARLIEIERGWTTSQEVISSDGSDDVERRLALALRANAELRAQLKHIEREIRSLRATPEGALAKELKRRRGGDPLDTVAEEVTGDLVSLRQVRDFVRSFQEGRISLAELLAGPDTVGEDGFVEMAAAVDLLVTMMREHGIDLEPPRPPARRKKSAGEPTRRRAGPAGP